jgi:N-acetylglutamate synthase-like GNAT family acetyltransferase
MEIGATELFGYGASVIIAYSLTCSSIVRLRWFNLAGASSFCLYGFIIDAYPVALLNGFIALTNIFFLRKMLLHVEEEFSVLKVNRPSNYVEFFLDYHKQEINRIFPRFLTNAQQAQRSYYFLTQGTQVVGMLSGLEKADHSFVVDFDFVIPAYRDFKLGHFLLGAGQELRNKFGFSAVFATADSTEHQQYLQTLGFSPNKDGIWSIEV